MYDAVADPYCYNGTTVLKNIPGLRTQVELDAFEAISTAARAGAPLPTGRLTAMQYRAIHKHLFQDVYKWAGRYRTVRLGKDGSAFCYPEHIAREMTKLFADLKAILFFDNASTMSSITVRYSCSLMFMGSLAEGQRVSFDIQADAKGSKAVNLKAA